jgi:hypothetical protein
MLKNMRPITIGNCPFPAILFSWGAPSIEGHSAFIQAGDWLYLGVKPMKGLQAMEKVRSYEKGTKLPKRYEATKKVRRGYEKPWLRSYQTTR